MDEVLALVEVDYTELEPVVDPLEALKPDAPQLHPDGNILTRQTLSRGDVDKAIAEAAFLGAQTSHELLAQLQGHEPAVISEREHHAHGSANLSRFEAHRIDGTRGGSPYASEVNNTVLKQDIQNTGGKDTSEAASFENKGSVGLVCDVGLGRDVGLVCDVGLGRNTHGACITCAVRDLLPQCRIHKIVLLAADSFKGSASSEAIEEYLEAGVLRVLPHARIKKVLIADGGEGTVDAFVSGCDGEIKSVQVEDPFGCPIVARLGMLPNGYAVVEMAETAGIRFSSCTDEDARRASTYGVGQLLRAALDLGVHRIYVGLGGSATSDGGYGMVEALGALFLDASGKPTVRGLEGLPYIAHVDMSHFDKRVYDTEIIALSDVNNPLSGKHGAIYTFGLQKGLLFSRLREYDDWMRHYAHAVLAATKDNHVLSAGAGAAGGLGFGLLSFCGASAMSGIQALLDAVHFDEQLQKFNLDLAPNGVYIAI